MKPFNVYENNKQELHMIAKINPSFWSDPHVEGLSPVTKLAALYLITGPQTNILGVCYASKTRFSFDTKLPVDVLSNLLGEMPTSFIAFDEGVWVRNFLRYQLGHGMERNGIFTTVKAKWQEMKESSLKAAILREYPMIDSPTPTPPLPHRGAGKEKEKEKEKDIVKDFPAFWDAYPRKVGKTIAATSYVKARLKGVTQQQLLDGIKSASASDQWTKDEGRFIPHPSTWLNQERWSDQLPPPPSGTRSTNPRVLSDQRASLIDELRYCTDPARREWLQDKIAKLK